MKDINDFLNEFNYNSRKPLYDDNSDYTTNAPSYYDDLARKGSLIKYLATRIWDYDKELKKRFAEWDKNLEEFDDEVLKLLVEWMNDGKFDDIMARILEIEIRDDLTVTVGLEGDFKTLNEAITFLSKFRYIHDSKNHKVDILLLEDFIMKEQVRVNGINLGWINITSENEEVLVDRQFINETDNDDGYATKSMFLVYNGGIFPRIDTIFNVNETGEIHLTRGFVARTNGKMMIAPFKGIKGGFQRLATASHGGTLIARQAIIKDGSHINIRVSNSGIFQGEYGQFGGAKGDVCIAVATGIANIDEANVSGGAYDGLRASTGPNIISAYNVDVSDSGRYGIHVMRLGEIGFDGGKANNCGEHGIFVDGGGSVSADRAECIGNGLDGIHVRGPGRVQFYAGNADNNGQYGLYADQTAIINAQNSKVNNCGYYNIASYRGSVINAQGGILRYGRLGGIVAASGARVNAEQAQARMGETDNPNDIVCQYGSFISAHLSVGGITPNVPNEISERGIIFR